MKIIDLFIKGGFLMYPIALCSILGLSIFIEKTIRYLFLLKQLEGSTEEVLEKKPEILVPILEALDKGKDEKELSLIGTRQIRHVEKGLSWLALIATVAPLLGLTGTVTGLIKAFMVVAESSSVTPSMLASGIWEALITTAAGLLVAIPLHIGHHYLEKKADEIAYVLWEITTRLYSKKNGV